MHKPSLRVNHVAEVYPSSGIYRVLIDYLNPSDKLPIKTVGIWMVPEYVKEQTSYIGYDTNGNQALLRYDDYINAALNAAQAWYEKEGGVPKKHSGLSFLGIKSPPEYIEKYENYTHPFEVEMMRKNNNT